MWRNILLGLGLGWSSLVWGQLERDLTIEHDGVSRFYDLYRPQTPGIQPMPLVVDLHYLLWTTEVYRTVSVLGSDFPADEFVVVYPHSGAGWNSVVGESGRDDVGFILATIDEISRQMSIDEDRIYVMGFSDGGEMAQRLICEAPDRFAAAATVAGLLAPEFEQNCLLPRPIPIIAFRGMNDQIVGFQGGTNRAGNSTLSASATLNFWRNQNNCQGPITTENISSENSCQVDVNCDGGVEVRLCVVEATETHTFRHALFDNEAGIDLRQISLDFMRPFVRPKVGFNIEAGLTGAWFDPANPGQGLLVEPIPQDQSFFAAWFTFEGSTTKIGADEQRWLTLQGAYSGAEAELDILSTSGGRFLGADPVESIVVGTASLRFASCTEANLSYRFDDGLAGEIALARLLPDTLCENPVGDAPDPRAFTTMNAGLSGAWFDPSTPGQGWLFDVVPAAEVLFAAWFTFAEPSDNKIGAVDQRWMTAQGSALGVESELMISRTSGGEFDAPQSVSTTNVGSGTVTFLSCTEAIFDFELESGEAGSVPLSRLAPDVFCEALTR